MANLPNAWMDKTVVALLSLTAVLCVISYNGQICDGQIVCKWIAFGITFCFFIILTSIMWLFKSANSNKQTSNINVLSLPFFITGIIVSIHSILQISGIKPVNSDNYFHVLAGFDNPAGLSAALAVSFPFAISIIDKAKDRRIRFILLSFLFLIDVSISIIAHSRVGFLSIGTVGLIYVIHNIEDKRKKKLIAILFASLLIVAVLFMSFQKKGSNSGRLLILNVCWEMFKDAPLFGHGIHGFRSQYMLYQADYLASCSSLAFSMLADNITHPMNEYVLLAVNLGLTGIATLLVAIAITIIHYFKNPSNESFIGIITLAAIGVLSLFSYPFRYPLTVLGLVCALLLVYKDMLLKFSRTTMIILRSIIATISAFCICFTIIWANYQIQWSNLSVVSDTGNDTKSILAGYRNLYPKLKNDPYFLYNYAYVLSENRDCKTAEITAMDSFEKMSNYDTALLIADNAKECGDADIAEEYYWLASKMCPARFLPLYDLFCLYKDSNRIDEMRDIGQKILSKPIKISSNEIRTIRSYVKQTLIKL